MMSALSDDLAYYRTQSLLTDPGRHASLFDDLPADVSILASTARNLVIHYRAESPLKYGIPKERLREIDTRHVQTMLARLIELKDAPIRTPRALPERLVACCRDFTLLFVSMARAKGIPARARVGFATYFFPGLYVDHEIAEVWDVDKQRWCLIDAQLADSYTSPEGNKVHPLDVSRDQFLVAGEAWKLCRAGKLDPFKFVVGPDLYIEGTRSWPQIKHNMVQDLVALLKNEMILWDDWHAIGRDDDERLCLISEATMAPEIVELQKLYAENKDIQIPEEVTSYDPLGGPPRQVLWQKRV
ncbi:hypothetical protein BG004_006393 [Podila humilis]|nr:hypothetical protein BG004_006393 [Podila humilis]